MKRIISFLLIILLLSSPSAYSEGLLPSLADTFGVDMPSMAVYLEREPDEETTDETGTVTQVFYQVSENDFDSFNKFLEENGCSLADYSVTENKVTETLEKKGKTFTFTYNDDLFSATLCYPLGSNPTQFQPAVEETSADNELAGMFSFSADATQKYNIHQAEKFNIGDYVKFGRYEQDNNPINGPEEIIWEIVDIQDGNALLVSLEALEYLPFEDTEKTATWETCSLRRWLNQDFYHSAFSLEEKAYIQEAELQNLPNPKYGTYSGSNTEDKVFLLSAVELNAYWGEYGTFWWSSEYVASKANDRYVDSWLRTSGATLSTAMVENGGNGDVDRYGQSINESRGVQPAIWISNNNPEMSDMQDGLVYLTFGTYEQDNILSNGKEPIEWLVLAKEENRVLMISRYALDCQPYNTGQTDVTWETCTLRTWLNGTFLNTAFSSEEQAMIPTVTVSADKNPMYSTNPGKMTKDMVFLLSIPEANRYFQDDLTRRCAMTAYAREQVPKKFSLEAYWWLRSPGYNQYYAAHVDPYRGPYLRININYGINVDRSDFVVRPALWIALDS